MLLMNAFLYEFFHHETNDRTEKGLVNIPADKTAWPESWRRVFYKQYGFFKDIALPHVQNSGYKSLLDKRRSSEAYISRNHLDSAMLGSIMECGYGLQDGNSEKKRKEHRTVPSAGKRYPLEIYIFLFVSVEGFSPGIYHYGVKKHVLEPILQKAFSAVEMSQISPIHWAQEAQALICISGVFHRITNKYGSRGYRYALLEAGHVAQNMLLAGTECGVNIVPLGGVNEAFLEELIGLRVSEERILYTLYL